MFKQSVLLVDGDPRGVTVLEVSLRKAGFSVATAVNSTAALRSLAQSLPDIIISEVLLDDVDGFEFCKRVKANAAWSQIPFVFLTRETAIEQKIRGLQLGVDEYLTKPIYIKEIVARLQIALQKRQRIRIEEPHDARARFIGQLADMAVVDLIQTIEVSGKSGVIQFTQDGGHRAAIYFRDGNVIDAEAGRLQGEDAVFRLLTWSDGAFEVVFRTVRRRPVISASSQGLLMEGMRRLDEWTRLVDQLPPLVTRLEVDVDQLLARLSELPDELDRLFKLADGRRSIEQLVNASDIGDLETLQTIAQLFFDGLLIETTSMSGMNVPSSSGISTLSGEWRLPSTIFEETPPRNIGPQLPRAAAVKGDFADVLDAEETPLTPADFMSAPITLPVAPAIAAPPAVATRLARATLSHRPSGFSLVDDAQAAAEVLSPELLPPSLRSGEASKSHSVPIGSMGAASAIASGEMSEDGTDVPTKHPSEREMVTIQPRRITRDIPVVTANEIVAASKKSGELEAITVMPVPDSGAVAGDDVVVRRVEDAGVQFARRESLRVGTIRAQKPSRIGLWAALGGAAFGGTLLIHHFGGGHKTASHVMANAVVATPSDAARAAVTTPDAASAKVVVAPTDARMVVAIADAASPKIAVAPVKPPVVVAPVKPPVVVAPVKPPVVMKVPPVPATPVVGQEWKTFRDAAYNALESGNASLALVQANKSLALVKNARAFLLKASALQKLGHPDEALASIDGALALEGGYAPTWQQKGQLLWSLGRHDEAKKAFTRFLELSPTGSAADHIRGLMGTAQ